MCRNADNTVETATTPQLIYRFNTTLIKILAGFFFFRKLTSSKFTWKYMRPRIAKTLKKKNKVSGRIFFISKLSTKRIIKTE